jgi:hypothetical protein
MAIAANTIPSVEVDFALPFDAQNTFTPSGAQTLTATGYMGAPTQLDLGGSTPASGAGRTDGIFSVLITAIDVASADESYRIFLLGSNDVAWANGNVEQLAMQDIAAASAGRIIATILGASPAIPPTGRAGRYLRIPFTNLRQGILFRYLRGYVVIGGTTPSITLQAWLNKATVTF